MRYTPIMIRIFILVMFVALGSLIFSAAMVSAQEPDCSIQIVKTSIPENNTPFDFSITGDLTDGFTLSSGGNLFTFGIDVGQTVTVTEEVTPGWELLGIECQEGTSNCGSDGFEPCLTATVIGNSVTFFCEDDDGALCTFTNVQVLRENIPTLSEWGLITMAVIIGAAGLFVALRRRKAAA